MKYHLRNLIIFILLIFSRLYAGDQPNIAIIDSLAEDIIKEILSGVQLSNEDTVALQIELENLQEVRYCQQLVSEILKQNSLTVFRNYNQLSSFYGLVIEISRFEVTVLYTEPDGDGLLGEDYTNRIIQVYLSGQIYNPHSGRIYNSISDERLYQDEIVYSLIGDMDVSEYGFSRGKRQGYSWWELYMEPFLVVSSVAVVVLLFFTQRN